MNLVPVQCRIGLAVFKGQNERFPKDVMALFRIIVYSKIQRYDRWITIYNLSRENYTADIKIFGKSVEKVYEFHQLGVTIDKLNWSRQIEKLCKKLSSALFSIKQIKFLPESSLVTTYRSPVESRLHHCDVVWGNCGSPLIEKLQRLQNRAIQLISKESESADLKKLFTD